MTVSVVPAMTRVSRRRPVSRAASSRIAERGCVGRTSGGSLSAVTPASAQSSSLHALRFASSSMKPMASMSSVTKSPVRR